MMIDSCSRLFVPCRSGMFPSANRNTFERDRSCTVNPDIILSVIHLAQEKNESYVFVFDVHAHPINDSEMKVYITVYVYVSMYVYTSMTMTGVLFVHSQTSAFDGRQSIAAGGNSSTGKMRTPYSICSIANHLCETKH